MHYYTPRHPVSLPSPGSWWRYLPNVEKTRVFDYRETVVDVVVQRVCMIGGSTFIECLELGQPLDASYLVEWYAHFDLTGTRPGTFHPVT